MLFSTRHWGLLFNLSKITLLMTYLTSPESRYLHLYIDSGRHEEICVIADVSVTSCDSTVEYSKTRGTLIPGFALSWMNFDIRKFRTTVAYFQTNCSLQIEKTHLPTTLLTKIWPNLRRILTPHPRRYRILSNDVAYTPSSKVKIFEPSVRSPWTADPFSEITKSPARKQNSFHR